MLCAVELLKFMEINYHFLISYMESNITLRLLLLLGVMVEVMAWFVVPVSGGSSIITKFLGCAWFVLQNWNWIRHEV